MRGRAVLAGLLLLGVLSGCGQSPVASPAAAALAAPVATPSPSPTKAPLLLPPGCSRRAAACVSTSRRLAWLQLGGHRSYGPVPVALGTRRQSTPHGTFHVVWKDQEHTSSVYGTDMPYSVFFAAGGIAFHQGPLDEPSHGCVHLPLPAASVFFAVLERGDRVDVF